MRCFLAFGCLLLSCWGGDEAATAAPRSAPRSARAEGLPRPSATRLPQPARTSARPAPAAPPLADAATQQVLAAGLASADYGTRLVATEALATVPGTWALAHLEARLGDVEPDVRAAAIEALRVRREPRAQRLLASVRDDRSEELSLRVLATWALVSPPSTSCP